MRVVDAKTCILLPLGRLRENEYTVIRFDVSDWLSELPDAAIGLYNQRPNETEAYPIANITVENGKVLWTVTSAELTQVGQGRCELVAIENEVVAKSAFYYTIVFDALGDNGETPEPWVDWQQQFVTLRNEAVEAAQNANPTGRVTTLDGTPLAGAAMLEAVGIPVHVSDVSQYSDYGLTETGWYIFARIRPKDNSTVTAETTVTGAAGVKMTIGAAYVDIAVKFEVAAASKSVTLNWGSYSETFVFKATDLAVRNLDYMARFYVYDISQFCTWDYALTTDTKFVAGSRYFTLNDGVYTEAIEGTDWTADADIPADTYYKHSKLTLSGMTPNVTYKLNDKLDCPLEIVVPEITDDGHGVWYEIQMNYSATFSCTLLPPTGVKVGTAQTQAQSAGINVIDLQYTDVNGVKLWTLLNTHSNIPA